MMSGKVKRDEIDLKEKRYTVKIIKNNGEKYETEKMTLDETIDWIDEWMDEEVYMVWDWTNNESVNV